jgi:hypothetical protein
MATTSPGVTLTPDNRAVVAIIRNLIARTRIDRVLDIREPPLLVVIRIELGDPRRPVEPQLHPRLLARLRPGVDKDRDSLSLLQRIDCVVADPVELKVGRAEANADNPIQRRLDPRLQRHETLLRGLRAQRLRGRAIDLRHERRGGHRERVADHARQPLVLLILQQRLPRLGELELGRHELDHAAALEIA